MELTLNVYEKTKVVKTYVANDFILTTGLCEDILNMMDIDKLICKNQEEQAIEVVKIVQKSFSKFKPFFQDIFDGLTEDEYRNTNIKEVASILIQIIKYTISELYSVKGTSTKN